MTTHQEVVTFGEAMGSIRSAGLLRQGGPMTLSVGGAESNVAIGLARLGHRVRWTGRVGGDEIGSLVLRALRDEGVDTGRVTIDQTRSTGLMLLERRVAQLSRVAYYRTGSAGSVLCADDLKDSFDADTRLLHLTGITPALSASAAEATRWAVGAARELGVPVSLDVNYRPALWSRSDASAVLAELASQASLVFASADELGLVGARDEEDAVQHLLSAGVDEVVVTRGVDGATAWTGSGHESVPARAVPVVDTVGAGDAFTAGYLSAWLDGDPVADRLRRGTALGAFAVSAAGDWESLPTRQELTLLDHPEGHTIR